METIMTHRTLPSNNFPIARYVANLKVPMTQNTYRILSILGFSRRDSTPAFGDAYHYRTPKTQNVSRRKVLNLWIRDLPFTLDHLSELPRYVDRGYF